MKKGRQVSEQHLILAQDHYGRLPVLAQAPSPPHLGMWRPMERWKRSTRLSCGE